MTSICVRFKPRGPGRTPHNRDKPNNPNPATAQNNPNPQRYCVFESAPEQRRSALVALIETTSSDDVDAITVRVRAGLRALDLPINELVYVSKSGIPKTTSAKKQHHEARALLAAGALPVVGRVKLARRRPRAEFYR